MSRLGILAEDDTDCRTVEELVRRVAAQNIGVEKRKAGGCAPLRRKAGAWMRELEGAGCSAVVVVHDIYRDPVSRQLKSVAKLREELVAQAAPTGILHLVCIPVEEIEAWFWSDPKVVKKVGRGTGAAHPSPHNIASPKEALQRLSRNAGNKPLYSTNDNPKLAKLLDLELCAKRCPAFAELAAFVRAFCSATPAPTAPARRWPRA